MKVANRNFGRAIGWRSVQHSLRMLVGVLTVSCVLQASLAGADESAPTIDSPVTAQDDEESSFTRYDALLASITIFVLAVFVGFEVITKVPTTLHTPLMSGANAISGITIVGALLASGWSGDNRLVPVLGTLAVIMASVNVVGGFLVTHRMLSMFRRK